MSLPALFNPRSIAIFGASENPASVSWRILTSLSKLGFDGAVYPINPKRDTVLGLPCYPEVSTLPGEVDAVAFCVTRDVIDANFQAVADHGIKAAALFATGFADSGDEGRAAEARINRIARAAGMAVVGPNGMGILNPATSSSLYSGIVENPAPLRGNVGVITQSGAIAVGLLTDCRRYGFSHVVSSGNEAVTKLHEFMEFLAQDEDTRVIALFIEAVRNVDGFTAALDRAAANGKPVVVLKVGKSEPAREAVKGHTGAVAGTGAGFSALLRRHRAIEVESPEEMNEVLAACQSSRLPRGPRIGHITASGGQVNMLLDAADRLGLQFPALEAKNAARMAEGTGISETLNNPVDAWGDSNWQVNLPRALEVMGQDANLDAVVFTSDTADNQPMRPTAYVGMLRDAAARSDKPHYFFNTRPGLFRQENVEALRGTGAAVIGGMAQGLAAIHRLGLTARTPAPEPLPPLTSPPPLPTEPRASINETDAKALMSKAGVICTRDVSVSDEANVETAARQVGFPLVLKASSDWIAHRSDHGLVSVGIADLETLKSERKRMLGILEILDPTADLVVSEQVPPGVEVLIGVTTDPELGLCLAVGPGGLLVELLSEVAIRPLPLCKGDAEAMLEETRLGKLLQGVRGAAPADRETLIQQIERIARLAHAWGAAIEEMDINPLIALPTGTKVADAVIFPSHNGVSK